MAARAIYKAAIEIGAIRIPVRFFSGLKDVAVRFHLLHAKDKVRVKQRMVNAETGEEVPAERVRMGAEVAPGEFVLLTKEELESVKPESERTIAIEAFVPPSAIDHVWYDRPYWLGPDEGGVKSYHALATALAEADRVGFARFAMRKKEYRGALRAVDGRLQLVTLRSAAEVVSASAIPAPSGREFTAAERSMAEQLVKALAGEFDPREYKNEHRERVLQLVETKAKGRKFKFEKYEPVKSRRTLEKMLEESLKNVPDASRPKARGADKSKPKGKAKKPRGKSRSKSGSKTGGRRG